MNRVPAALEKIAAVSGTRAEPPTLLPARIITELSGEAVRARLCTFADATGEEQALRPDFTTPIARAVAAGEMSAARYHYAGTVWRLPSMGSNEATEFAQIGFEWFGGGGLDEDAEAVALSLEAASAGGTASADVRFGDVAIFRAVVDALGFSPRWTERLKRAFARRRGPKELLEAALKGEAQVSPLAAGLSAMGESEAVAAVAEIFAIAGVQPVGGRDAAEIASRLREQAGDRAPPAEAAKLVGEYLALSAPVKDSVKRIEAFAKAAGVNIAPALEAFRVRLEKVAALKPAFWETAAFSAQTGRRFEYYDGFVFELARAQAWDRPIASGGRYDGLIAKLSGQKQAASAIGAALRVDRLGDAS